MTPVPGPVDEEGQDLGMIVSTFFFLSILMSDQEGQ